jgi:menaquinone-9 beta-reductase
MISIHAVHKYDCDVLITGGGPSGSALAFHLARKGIKVIVLEAEKFPRDKTCGDAVSRVALTELQELGITGLSAFASTNIVKDVALFIEQEKISVSLTTAEHTSLQGRVIPRLQLDNWIYEAAKNAGACYLESTRLVSYTIQEDYVSIAIKQGTQARSLKAKVIVGADGSNSTVARLFHGSKPDENYQLLGLRAYYEGVSGPANQCDIYFTKENFPGLFWFFPTGKNTANVGSAMIANTLPKNETHVKTLLNDQILKNKNLAARIGKGKIVGKIAGWPLTFQSPTHTIIGHRLLLVGDAAGLINPLSGDGIQYALLSARWASECLATCVAKNDFSLMALGAYKEKLNKEMAYDMAVSNLLIKITRNRTFAGLWMEVLLIVFERARTDKDYAAIIAGIFDGTLPSYKALNLEFILKSVLQGGLHIGSAATTGILQGPAHWEQKTKHTRQLLAAVLQNIREHPQEQLQWLKDIAKKGLEVSGHILKEIKGR